MNARSRFPIRHVILGVLGLVALYGIIGAFVVPPIAKRVIAKELTMRQCRAMGWEVEDDNEADALAVWHFMCSILEPKLAVAPTCAATRA